MLKLMGTGYLLDIIRNDDDVKVRINIVNASNGTKDDVWVDCDVRNHDLIELMSFLEHELNDRKTVILSFAATYSTFKNHQPGLTEDDSVNILHLTGELLSIRKYFIDVIMYDTDLLNVHRTLAIL